MLVLGCHTHEWEEATCVTKRKCRLCGEIDETSELKDHELGNWITKKEPNCSEKGQEEASCKVCGQVFTDEIDVDPEAHNITDWQVSKKATCTESGEETGKCSLCGKEFSREIDKVAHTPGDWEIVKKASLSESGTRVKKCTVCGEDLESESFELDEKEREKLYKDECKSVSYKEMARDPEAYKGKYVKVTGEVIQVVEATSSLNYCSYRVDITKKGSYYTYYTDTVYINYDGFGKTPKIIEDDIVTFWGVCMGSKTYETVMGASVTIPYIVAEYISIK